MAFFTLKEIFDMIFMSIVVGFIFMNFLKRFRKVSLEDYGRKRKWYERYFNWKDFKFAVIVTAPAILLHEMGHKFVAMGFGFEAIFNAAYVWLGLGVLMSFAGFIFFVPAYVSITNPLGTGINPGVFSIIAFAGPAVNLLLFLLAWQAMKRNWFDSKYKPLLYLTKNINLLLFVFNMLPIPGFDGYKVYTGLFRFFF